MKRLFGYLAAIFLSVSSFAATGDKDVCFKPGERLDFSIHYKWGLVNADVAQATLKLDAANLSGRQVYHASLTGKTQKIYESLFKVREDLDSWFTTDTFIPLKFTRESREGNYSLSNSTTFSWNASGGTATAKLNTSRKGEFTVVKQIDRKTLDIPTMFYHLRTLDLSNIKEGTSYPLSFIMDDDVYPLHFIYLGKSTRNIKGVGKVRCLKFGFEVVAGDVFSGDSDLYCWITDDENRIPVYFTAPLKIGAVQGRLVKYSGLSNSFDSIVE